MDAMLSISNRTSTLQDDRVVVRIVYEEGTSLVEISLTHEALAQALLGSIHQPCHIEFKG